MKKLTCLLMVLAVYIMVPTIADAITVSISDVAQNENNGNMVFTVTITDGTVSGTAGFAYATTDGSAETGDADYSNTTGTVTFSDAETVSASRTFNVPITGDTKVEADESFTVTLTPQGGDTVTGSPATGTITNDDTATLSINDVTQAEGSGGGSTNFVFTVSLDNAVQGGFDVAYTTNDGTAMAGSDYTDNDTSLTFTGSASETQNITVVVAADDVVEAGEQFTVMMGAVTPGSAAVDAADITTGAIGTGTITNDDTFGISVNDSSAAEGSNVTFTVMLGADVDVAVNVTYDASDGTATVADNDYTDAPGSVTFPAGSTVGATQTFTVATGNDSKAEPDEVFTVTVGSAHGSYDGNDDTGTGTITNDDTFGISVNDSSANEGSDVMFTITVDAPRSMDVDVTYTTSDGTATLADSDYTQHVVTVVTIPAGAVNQTQPITVATTGDTKVEEDETFTVTVSSTHGSYDGNDDTGTGTITDNDEYSISISGAPSVVEGNQALFTVTVTPQVQTGDTVTVQYSTTDSSAVAPGDYTAETNKLMTFGEGESIKNATVDTIDDAVVENDETFTVTLNSPTTTTGSVSIADGGPKTGTITDNDEYSISISGAPSVVEGNQATFSVTVTPQVQTGDTVTVQYSTSNGSAASPGDYIAETNTALTFNGGDSTLNATVDTNDDAIVENDETFTVIINSPSTSTGSVSIADPGPQTGTIQDNGDIYNVSITHVAPDPAREGIDPTIAFTVELGNVDVNGVVGTVDVDYATADGTADGSDYTSASGTLTFTSATGPTLTVPVTILNDDLMESDETFNFTLSVFTGGGSITGTNPATGTINDDTDKCGIFIDGPFTVTEGSSITFNVSINQVVPFGQPVTVQYETTDDTAVAEGAGAGDYDAISLSTLTFAVGEGPGNVKQIIVQTNDDSLYESQEHFTVDLSNQSFNAAIIAGQGDGYIDDDGDKYDVSIEATETVTEGTDATVTFTVTLDQEVPGGTSVSFTLDDVTALLGSDYSENTPVPTLNFAEDETTKDVVVNITNDDLYEVPETFEVNITCADPNSTLSNGKGTCTINDDGIDTYNVSITAVPVPDPVLEADTTVIFTVTLDQEVPGGASVDFSLNDVTAALGSDYSQNTANPLNFAAGEITKDIIVNILNDQVDEDSEAFEVIITSADSNAILVSDTGTCTITDNDYTVTFNIATVGPGPDGGTVNGVLSLDQVVDHGTDCVPVTAAAVPPTEYRFVEWTGDYNGTVNPLTITNVTSDMIITANFIAIYTITATAGANGTISPSGAVIVDYGTDETFTFDPNTCYEVDDVLVDGISEGGEIREYTFINVTADHDIDVQFYHYDCTITATAEHGGTITPSGAVTVPCGSNQSFTISAGMGNEIAEVLVDGVDLGLGTGITTYNHNWTNVKKDDDDTSPCVHYIVAKFTRPALSCMDISDTPLNAMSRSAPANIMFVLDDSGSMDWEFMTDENNGMFSGKCYVFNNPGDNIYTWYTDGGILTGNERLRWKSQWSGYNRMYYDTNVDYNPWPTRSDANPDFPQSHPMHAGNTLDLHGIYESVVYGGSTINIRNAHFYAWSASESKPYLVIIDSGSIEYYEVNDDGDNVVEANELAPTATPPADVVTGRSVYAEERQNFANWYSFYRKRELTATAAIANVINNMQGVNIGFRSINGNLNQPVLKIKIGAVDETNTLLTSLYALTLWAQGTPLRTGLQRVGQYFDDDDSGNTGGIGASPYASVAEGGECQQCFAIVMTDGYYNGGSPGVGNRDIDDPAGDPDNSFDGPPYEDAFSDTLADVAMYYYENDLSSTLGPEVPKNGWDENEEQHMVTYGVSFGVTGTLDPSAYDFISTFPTWPNPTSGDQQKIDDLWHASVNGRGFFLSASNPNELVNSLLDIMQNIEEREGSASSVSVNGDELYTKLSGGGNILMFQSSYDTENWTGDVKAYQVCTQLTGNCAGKNIGDIITSPYVWSANEKLGGLNWNTGRKIVTYNGTNAGTAFRWGDLTTDQQTALNNDSTLLDYLRGNTTNEVNSGGAFRDRFAKLGDMVHSSPTFENGVLYAGGNDGMLHAFAAADDEPYSGAVGGRELFAYVPNLVFDNLSQLADPNYTHKYFVDLTPAVKAGVNISGVSTTVLVGGLAKGGRGYYALDVTDPTSWTSEGNVAGKVMWEYPKAGVTDDDMGYSFSKAAIIESNDDDVNGGSGWIVIFGNGYNSQNGHAVLYILNPETGDVIRKIDTNVDGCNGLSTFVPIDVDYDNKVDYVYVGDLRGNVWKFDLTDTDYTNWEVAFYDGEEKPLFQAQGPGGTTQPITAKPDVMYHPTEHGYMVLFSTGQYLGESDISETTAQSFYGIWDYGDDEDDKEYLGSFRRGLGQELSNQPNTVSLVAQQVIPSESPDPNAPDFWTVTLTDGAGNPYDLLLRLTTDNEIVWETMADPDGIQNPPQFLPDLSDSVDNHAGWYFDLPLSGERGIVDLMIRGGIIIAISFIPEDTPCGYGGDSVIHEMNAASGARLTRPQFDINGDGVIDDDDMINIGTALNPIWVVPSGMKKSGQLQPPAILIDPERGVEIKYLSSSSGYIEKVYEKPPLLGISHWREFE